MGTLCTLRTFYEGIHWSSTDSPAKGPTMRSFDISFAVNLKKLIDKQYIGWWFQTLICSYNVIFMYQFIVTVDSQHRELPILLMSFFDILSDTSYVVKKKSFRGCESNNNFIRRLVFKEINEKWKRRCCWNLQRHLIYHISFHFVAQSAVCLYKCRRTNHEQVILLILITPKPRMASLCNRPVMVNRSYAIQLACDLHKTVGRMWCMLSSGTSYETPWTCLTKSKVIVIRRYYAFVVVVVAVVVVVYIRWQVD